jgi:outer membrane protein assembly factor BamD (BamD/ComL family)
MAKGQKKQKQTPEALALLKVALSSGSSNVDACKHAKISETTFYRWLEEDQELREEIAFLRTQPILKAKANIMNALNAGDVKTSQWYLERTRPDEYAPKTRVDQVNRNIDYHDEESLAEALGRVFDGHTDQA